MLEPTPQGWPDYAGLRFRDIGAWTSEISELRAALKTAQQEWLDSHTYGREDRYAKAKRTGDLTYMLHLALLA
jgi:hypothetical protein